MSSYLYSTIILNKKILTCIHILTHNLDLSLSHRQTHTHTHASVGRQNERDNWEWWNTVHTAWHRPSLPKEMQSEALMQWGESAGRPTRIDPEACAVELSHVEVQTDDGEHEDGKEQKKPDLEKRHHGFHDRFQNHLET